MHTDNALADGADRDEVDSAHLLGIEVLPGAAWTHVRVSGEIDLQTQRFADVILSVLDERRSATVIVDLTDVTFMGSVGMTALVMAQRRAASVDTRLIVVAEGAATARPLEIVGLTKTLPLYPTLHKAIASLETN